MSNVSAVRRSLARATQAMVVAVALVGGLALIEPARAQEDGFQEQAVARHARHRGSAMMRLGARYDDEDGDEPSYRRSRRASHSRASYRRVARLAREEGYSEASWSEEDSDEPVVRTRSRRAHASRSSSRRKARASRHVASVESWDESDEPRVRRSRHTRHGDRRRQRRGVRVASLGDGYLPPRRHESLSGGGGIRWAASSSCLNSSLRAVIAQVAANFGSVTVNSTCRSRGHNARVGGARHSHHLTGNAVDFRVHGRVGGVYSFLRSSGSVGGLKHYGGGLFHIDTGPRRTW